MVGDTSDYVKMVALVKKKVGATYAFVPRYTADLLRVS